MSFPMRKSTVEAQPLIAVRNVRASSRWYTELLGADSLPEHGHRDVYDRISRSGQLFLQLHAWDKEDHPNLVNADAAPPGHGVLLWFQVDDFDSVWNELAAWAPRLSKNPTSSGPDIERFGFAIPTVMWWWLPVRTVNAVRNFCATAALDSVQGRGIFTLVHRYRLPHSNVSSGLLVTSYTTRLTPLTSLMMRVAAPPILRALRKRTDSSA